MARIALFISLITFPLMSFATPKTWLDTSFVKRAFLEVALKNEYSSGDKPLVKWQQPIKIWVKHKVADQILHDELVDAHLLHLQKITGHSISRVSTRKHANVIWIFTRESLWQQDISQEIGKDALKHIHGAICTASYRVSVKNKDIVRATVIVPVDQSRAHGKLLACIVEEITQVMGLPNDSQLAYPSIFNDRTPDDLLSPLDVVLLKLLYEPSLKSGMSKSQVSDQIDILLVQYQRDGILKNAVNVSRSAPLWKILE
ncbi:DUF2927 domain-containing protein [Vibrio sinensis]|uniref:DUF2927 domain-containing protein n=1 Tax=Vibrio sinensis TaxID=2302434 RepID=A0A3A6QE57_9VIBR|nr:DUF2927 domain-containing protein [Vibrio sinensis]